MSIKQKIYVYLGLIVLLIAILGIWGFFAFQGKTDVASYIAQLGGLVTIVITAVGALGGFHSGRADVQTPIQGISLAAFEPLEKPADNDSAPASVPADPGATQ
ncbi:hypothetical protein [Pandoraea sp. SD6-2]|uniref:hypothetical protein n=1 Tax=Pandoraea sp. SD6-2 TaxID=1286093 RepID=UPI00032F6D3F|nr:hypothetical protein [Pandoraea sp. SD6-2]EON14860.1 hypothetical protein C266_04587 [Pandoraea sp. SD6-2]